MTLSVPIRIALFYAAIFLVVGVAVPFWPVWLKSRGLGAAEIGLIMSVTSCSFSSLGTIRSTIGKSISI